MASGSEKRSYRPEVESLLDTTLYADGLKPLENVEPGATDVRQVAANFALRAIARRCAISRLVAQTFDQLDSWQMSEEEERDIRQKFSTELKILSRAVDLANDIELSEITPPKLPAHADPLTTPRSQTQARSISRTNRHLIAPKPLPGHNGQIGQLVSSPYMIVGPPGVGKTRLEADFVYRLTQGSSRPRRILGVLASQAAFRQFTDPEGTFMSFLPPDIEVTADWEEEHTAGGQLHLQSATLLRRAVESRRLDLDSFDAFFVDEGHRRAARFLSRELDGSGKPLVLYTGSPYNKMGDLRQFYPHYENVTILEAIKCGILNDLELNSFQAGKEKHSAEVMAAKIALARIKQGRNMIVYCQPGGRAAQAGLIADLINQLAKEQGFVPPPELKWSGGPIAEAISSYAATSKKSIENFARGLCCLVTTSMLEESYDPPSVKGAGIGCVLVLPDYSLRRMVQRIGRVLRPNDLHSTADEIHPPVPRLSKGRQSLSVFHAVGLDYVQQGILITRQDQGMRFSSNRAKKQARELILPEEILAARMPEKPLRMAFLGYSINSKAATKPPEGYVITSDEIAAAHNAPKQWIERLLARQNLPHADVYPGRFDNDYTRMRWYDEATVKYLEENPILEQKEDTRLFLSEIEEATGASRSLLERIIEKYPAEMEIQSRQSPRNRLKARTFGPKEVAIFIYEIEQIPVADPDDETAGSLGKETSSYFIDRCIKDPDIPVSEPPDKHRNPIHGIRGITRHFSAAECRILREEWKRLPKVTNEFIGFKEISEIAGVGFEIAYRDFLSAGPDVFPGGTKPETKLLRPARGGPGHYLRRPEGKAFAEYLKKSRQLSPTKVSLPMLSRRYGDLEKSNILSRLRHAPRKFEETKQNIAGRGAPTTLLDWEAMFYLDSIYGIKLGPADITLQDLATNSDATKEQIEKSQELQAVLAPIHKPSKRRPGQASPEPAEIAADEPPPEAAKSSPEPAAAATSAQPERPKKKEQAKPKLPRLREPKPPRLSKKQRAKLAAAAETPAAAETSKPPAQPVRKTQPKVIMPDLNTVPCTAIARPLLEQELASRRTNLKAIGAPKDGYISHAKLAGQLNVSPDELSEFLGGKLQEGHWQLFKGAGLVQDIDVFYTMPYAMRIRQSYSSR